MRRYRSTCLEAVPQPVVVLLDVLLEKDPGQRFQSPAELLKAIPTIIGAVDAKRRITRQSLQKTLVTEFVRRNWQAGGRTGAGRRFP